MHGDFLEIISLAVSDEDILNGGVMLTLEQAAGFAGGNLVLNSDGEGILIFYHVGFDGRRQETVVRNQRQVEAVLRQLKMKMERLARIEVQKQPQVQLTGFSN